MTASDLALRHVVVVGGSVADWSARDDGAWQTQLADLGAVADAAGARWLTLRPAHGAATGPTPPRRSVAVGGCTVTADPSADGRARFVAAVESLRTAGRPIDEASIAAALNAPALADPDLTLVLGQSDRLPPSLVWELAYTELVYLDLPWDAVSAAHVAAAISSFAHRHRRFGGVD